MVYYRRVANDLSNTIKKRKRDHLRIALSDEAQIGNPGFDRHRFVHNALPEIDFDKIDTSTTFLGKKVNYPFFISCMTGGEEKGQLLNQNLAKAAQKMGIAMGVGSQRAAIKYPELQKTFEVRKYAPDIPVLANVGIVQLNYGFGLKEFQKCVDMVQADALAVHINPVQEVIQPEGDRNFEKLLPKFEKIIKKLSVPVIVKEVGFGLSEDVVRRLYNIGVRIFDTAGWGGTNWAYIDGKRRPASAKSFGEARMGLGDLYSNWGISTTESIRQCDNFRSKLVTKDQRLMTILGSGGVRSGLDVAKCLALGADMVGIAQPFGKAGLKSSKEVEKLIEKLGLELKIAMLGVGARDIKTLKKKKLLTDTVTVSSDFGS